MSGTYFKTCPRCGANLAPGETCDCRKITLTEDDLTPFEEWMEGNKGDWSQRLSVSKMMLTLNTEERYIVFRTAARLANIGMTEEERAMTGSAEPKKGEKIA